MRVPILTILAILCAILTLFYLGPVTDAEARMIDRGGLIASYAGVVAEYNREGLPYRISGDCYSACTMKLAIRKVCIEPDAVLYFHAATHYDDNYAGEALMETYIMGGSVKTASGHPRFERLYRRVVGWLVSPTFHAMTGKEAISLGVPECK